MGGFTGIDERKKNGLRTDRQTDRPMDGHDLSRLKNSSIQLGFMAVALCSRSRINAKFRFVPKKVKNFFDFLSCCLDGEVLKFGLGDNGEFEQNLYPSKDFDKTFTAAFWAAAPIGDEVL